MMFRIFQFIFIAEYIDRIESRAKTIPATNGIIGHAFVFLYSATAIFNNCHAPKMKNSEIITAISSMSPVMVSSFVCIFGPANKGPINNYKILTPYSQNDG